MSTFEISPLQGASPTEEPRRRLLSGGFVARNLTAEWLGWERLAALAEQADFTTNEARAVLLRQAYDKSAREIAVIMDARRPNVWRYLRHAGGKVLRTFPDLDAVFKTWREQHKREKVEIIACARNGRGSDRSPLFMQNGPGRWREVTGTRLVDWTDLAEFSPQLAALEALGRMAHGEAISELWTGPLNT